MRLYIYKVTGKGYFVVAAANSAVADRMIREHLVSCGWEYDYKLFSQQNLDEPGVLVGMPLDGIELGEK